MNRDHSVIFEIASKYCISDSFVDRVQNVECGPLEEGMANHFSIPCWGIGLDYHNIGWFALETNRDHSVIFEIASKNCISDSFVDYEGYSVSSKEFLSFSSR